MDVSDSYMKLLRMAYPCKHCGQNHWDMQISFLEPREDMPDKLHYVVVCPVTEIETTYIVLEHYEGEGFLMI